MTQKCVQFLKYTLFAFNLIFWVCGCLILGFGIYLMMQDYIVGLFPSVPFFSISNTLIIVGTIIMVVSFLGCLGSLKENKCLLCSFFILLLLLLVTEVSVAVVLLVKESEIEEQITKELKTSLSQYQNSTSKTWDEVQKRMECCGISSSKDWIPEVPGSCCKTDNCDVSKTDNLWKEGCLDKVKKWFEKNYLNVGIGIICISIIQVLGMSFAITLYCHISKSGMSFP
ncbi:leukocyte surface antigen CD53 [Polypterus senegalus]|uniref:leukocyte surface antigen CD53 n=1 Tax=Polypterus senegalus TaxID=55291 RepID=UPI00196539F7|nr:leukocyte surface antigen CD53 [Polypterus senegalus]XP_039605201.1 leukocyte surface antigen CD53 [Polypterus senegalus]